MSTERYIVAISLTNETLDHRFSDYTEEPVLAPDGSVDLEWLNRSSWRAVMFPTPWNGPGSKWETLPRWSWGDPPEVLAGWARRETLTPDAAMDLAGFNDLHDCGHPRGEHAAWRNRETWGFPCCVDGCDCEGTDLD